MYAWNIGYINSIKSKRKELLMFLDKYQIQKTNKKCHAYKKTLSPISTANAAISVTHSQLESDSHRNSMFMLNSHWVHL